MTLKPDQISRFTQLKNREFEDFMIEFLSTEFPDTCAAQTEPELRERIRTGEARAREYDIADENSIAKFLYLTWLLGGNFEELPNNAWLTGLDQDRSRPALHRMDLALDGVAQHFEEEEHLQTA